MQSERNTTPEVSVITTVKNGLTTLPLTLQSVLEQKSVSHEYIIVDDGSTDGTLEYLEKFNHPNLRVLKNPKPGRGRALNFGLKHARAPWICVLDADDVAHPQRLALSLQVIKNSEYAVLGTSTPLIFDEEVPVIKEVIPDPTDLSPIEMVGEFMFGNPISHTSVIMRKSALDAIGGYEENRLRQFDYSLWLNMKRRGFKMANINIGLTYKRIHKNQSFENKKRLQYILGSMSVQKEFIKMEISYSRKISAYIFMNLRLVWAVLPQKFRMIVRGRSND